jgi:hypothetical protein
MVQTNDEEIKNVKLPINLADNKSSRIFSGELEYSIRDWNTKYVLSRKRKDETCLYANPKGIYLNNIENYDKKGTI